jgi:hypothetical protein
MLSKKYYFAGGSNFSAPLSRSTRGLTCIAQQENPAFARGFRGLKDPERSPYTLERADAMRPNDHPQLVAAKIQRPLHPDHNNQYGAHNPMRCLLAGTVDNPCVFTFRSR